jgi:hypothetical protein
MAIPFLEKLQSLFSQNNDPKARLEAEKRKLLKMTARDLAQCRYRKFYRLKTEEVEGDFGKFFYNIYKTLAPAQVFMQKAGQSSRLKACVVESLMSEKSLEASERLTASSITEWAKTVTPPELAKQVKADLDILFVAFDAALIKRINGCYNTILRFANFVTFNYYEVMKRFDATMSERNFTYTPQFGRVLGEHIVENLKDFLEVAYALDAKQDWKQAIEIINAYKEAEIVSLEQWGKLLSRLHDVQSSSIFLLVIRLLDKDPVWQAKAIIPNEHIAESWLEEKRLEAQETIEKIVNAKKNAAIAALANAIFATTDIGGLQYYTETAHEAYIRKNLEGFPHTAELAYIQAFIQRIFKKEMNELCDIFLIKGQWRSQQLSQQMSDAVRQFAGLSDKILAFDNSLAASGEYGDRLRIAVAKAERDRVQVRYANSLLKTINSIAQNLINSAGQYLIIVGKFLKTLMEDKPLHKVLMNWKELEAASESPLFDRIEDGYKKVYTMVKLLQIYSKPFETE